MKPFTSRTLTSAAIIIAILVVLSGCGSRRAERDLLAAATRTGQTAAAGAATSALSPSSAGTALDPASAGGATGPVPGSDAATAADGTGAPGDSAAATSPGNRSVIKLGTVGVMSGIGGEALKGQYIAVRAWEKWINDQGGIDGHPVDVTFIDDHGDPSQALAAKKKLVEEDHVVAFVANSEGLTGRATLDYENQVRVPVVGGDGTMAHVYDSQYYFPESSYMPYRAISSMAAIAAVAPGAKVATIVCQEDQNQCAPAADLWAKLAARFGLQVVYQARSSIAQPDFTTECLGAQQNGATVVLTALDSQSQIRLARSCSRQSYTPRYGAAIADDALLGEPTLDGLSLASQTFPFTSSSTPARAEFQHVLDTYAPGTPRSTNLAVGWTSAKLLEKALRTVADHDTITSDDVLAGLWSIHDDDLGGLTYPLSFVQGANPTPSVCWSDMTISHGHWVALGDESVHCSDVRP